MQDIVTFFTKIVIFFLYSFTYIIPIAFLYLQFISK